MGMKHKQILVVKFNIEGESHYDTCHDGLFGMKSGECKWNENWFNEYLRFSLCSTFSVR